MTQRYLRLNQALRDAFSDRPGDTRTQIVALLGSLVGVNLIVGAVILGTFASRPTLIGTALLAYAFGLRHAVDADHISAIDNVTRKLMREGKRPVAVGLFFSLGHSTIVFALTAAIALAAATIRTMLPAFQNVGGIVGTVISALFLYGIAAINLVVLVGIIRQLRRTRAGGSYDDAQVDAALEQRGLLGRFLAPLLRATSASRNMYPIGVLFGLGFDTATEVGLLGIAALEASKGLPVYAIMLFPLAFAAGMCLLDTLDGILMLGAYGWAFISPQRKLSYNVTVTLVSVLVAVLVGTLEVLAVVGAQLHAQGPFWAAIAGLNDNFGAIGFAIVATFALAWGGSVLICRFTLPTRDAPPDARTPHYVSDP